MATLLTGTNAILQYGWDGGHRGGWDGDGDRGFHRHYRDYDPDREVIAYPYGYSRPVASFQIIIGHRERH